MTASDLSPADAIRVLNEEAMASPPGANGLVVLPYFSGALTPLFDPDAKGMIFGLDLTHTRGDMFRAVLEGIAQATRHIIETYGEAGQPPREVFAVGGGTQKQGVGAGHVRHLRHGAALREKTMGRLLRRCLPRGACGGRCEARRHGACGTRSRPKSAPTPRSANCMTASMPASAASTRQ